MTEKKQLDLEAFERSINRMIDAGVDGLFFLGSSGEVAFLTDAQRYHVLQEAVAIVNHRVPVLAGIIDMETLRVVDHQARARNYGVDALVTAFRSMRWAAQKKPSAIPAPSASIRTCRCSLTTCPCACTRSNPTMLVRLGKDGVLQGVGLLRRRRELPLAGAGGQRTLAIRCSC